MAWHQLCSETRRSTRCARPASAWRPTPRLRRRIKVSSTPTKLPTRIRVHIGSRATLSTSRLFLFTCLSRSSISFSLLSKVFVSLFFSRSTFFLSYLNTNSCFSILLSLIFSIELSLLSPPKLSSASFISSFYPFLLSLTSSCILLSCLFFPVLFVAFISWVFIHYSSTVSIPSLLILFHAAQGVEVASSKFILNHMVTTYPHPLFV